ncbi:hypothetical protein C8Q80DRAFT_1125421 [Daedaleopsis nitida]|nr:hypothetical protein C8Q80DRAFT_1125421 [Daedaleopsis nitida]
MGDAKPTRVSRRTQATAAKAAKEPVSDQLEAPIAADAPLDEQADEAGPPPDPTPDVEIFSQMGDKYSKTPALKPVSGKFEPIPTEDSDGYLSELVRKDCSSRFAICTSLREVAGDDKVRQRLYTALTFGHTYLSRGREALHPSTWKTLSTEQREEIFPIEMMKLDEVVLSPWQISPFRDGFWPDEEDLDSLRSLLEARRHEAAPTFRQQGKTLPSVPVWGRDLSHSAYVHTANDFEILAACFRMEVEYFLKTLFLEHCFAPNPFWGRSDPLLQLIEDAEEETTRARLRKPSATPPAEHAPTRKGIKPLHEWQRQRDGRDTPPHLSRSCTAMTPAPFARNEDRYEEALRPVKREHNFFSEPPRGTAGMAGLFTPPRREGSRAPRTPNGVKRGDASGRGGSHGRGGAGGDPSGSEPSDDEGDDGHGTGGNGGFPPRRPSNGPPGRGFPRGGGPPDDGPPGGGAGAGHHGGRKPNRPNTSEAHFDFKLKSDIVPSWDGDTDRLARWIIRVNAIAKRSDTIRQQLGMIVPQRLTGDAELWYYSLSEEQREQCEENWESIRDTIGGYYMNRAWIDRTRKQARSIRYRERGHEQELPSQYFIRKKELLDLAFDYTESETIAEILTNVPLSWHTLLDQKAYGTALELQAAIKLREEQLVRMDSLFQGRTTTNREDRRPYIPNPTPYRARANVSLTGYTPNMPPPPFPKDDSNVSKRRTPESKNGRPCRHCGSGKHWDNECKYARKGMKFVRANLATTTEEDTTAQEEYDALYYDDLSDSEDEDSARQEQDF